MYNDWIKSKIEVELGQADRFRREGFEGRARVCARRAAGIAIRDYFRRHEIPDTNLNALGLVQAFRDLPDISPELRRSAEMLLLRVDESSQLPPEIDLLELARFLVQELDRQ